MRFDNVRTDNVNNIDLSVLKNAALGGGRILQFRFESLNAFNHPLFPTLNANGLADQRAVRGDRRVDAAELRTADAGDD